MPLVHEVDTRKYNERESGKREIKNVTTCMFRHDGLDNGTAFDKKLDKKFYKKC